MSNERACFKAYDIRGRIPDELNDDLAYRIGRAYAVFLRPRKVAVGHDVRLSSPALSAALANGLRDAGVEVMDIGQCGTEEIYFAVFHHQLDGGIMVTASHNPMDYNGMKLVQEQAKPISGDSGLFAIRDLSASDEFTLAIRPSNLIHHEDKSDYIRYLLGAINIDALKPLKIVVNGGNGGAGPIIDALEPQLPFQFVKIHHEPDGSFPNGIPNPLLPECREATAQAVREHGADLGLAWDGDFDRCFFFDETGRFIEGYYLVGLLAEILLARQPGAKIVHDPRLTWNTIEQVRAAGGVAVQNKTGHAFMKERMRLEDALYGGEMSAHHYFRDFAYCDSGMIPWLLVAEHLCRTGQPLSTLVDARMQAFPCSGEINFRVDDAQAKIREILVAYADQEPELDETDGISLEFPNWRFNLRCSNTEPLLRLNVETRGDAELLERRTKELRRLITG
ncbi:phosphomannomutase/phosphoglucomutase [Candidatus Contendibacter odensensis]|uniref:phosphomannomutase n=1 Tax=Candidatus Contendobacter odensis Run_B_J11 TaxID=1400861 RepID=A0A7U7GD64_9GAMM|nr:phosphomannomutase/phosphoglucomutase [Candidatus Contendobacter odensis]CDH45913.1 Phosphohexose mutases (Includes: Phosphoglucomutase; Phosphomannomutase) [Candidatus Contendobacter odensis Run_B_J11]